MSMVSKQAPDFLYAESFGKGEDVVLLHGWGMHGAYWNDMVDGLQSAYCLHCIDLPGHGHSAYHNETSLDDFVAQIKSTIDNMTQRPVHLIGWSLGGLMSQKFCLTYPERVKSLTLIASSASFVQRVDWQTAILAEVLEGFADNLLQDYRSTLNRFLALQVMGSDDQKQILRSLKAKLFSRGEPDQEALMAGLSLLRKVDLRAEISAIEVPVMLLGGERDTLVPQQALSAMANYFSKAEVHAIKGAGHAPFLSHPEAVINIIKAFLNHD